jgi:hypothetical protein
VVTRREKTGINNNNHLFAQQNQIPITGQKIKRNSNLSKSKSNSK